MIESVLVGVVLNRLKKSYEASINSFTGVYTFQYIQ